MKELIEIAKILQSALEKWAGEDGGARVWLTELNFLHAMVWASRAEDMTRREKGDIIWEYVRGLKLSSERLQKIRAVTVFTQDEYEERYFFTKPPFCEEG